MIVSPNNKEWYAYLVCTSGWVRQSLNTVDVDVSTNGIRIKFSGQTTEAFKKYKSMNAIISNASQIHYAGTSNDKDGFWHRVYFDEMIKVYPDSTITLDVPLSDSDIGHNAVLYRVMADGFKNKSIQHKMGTIMNLVALWPMDTLYSALNMMSMNDNVTI